MSATPLNAVSLSSTQLSAIPLKCVSMTNQKCKIRQEIVNFNSDEPVFYPFSIKTSKCSGSRNNINDPHAKMCVPDVIKNINVKVFNLISRTNETNHTKWHETCKCKCRLDASDCNYKQRWNDDKCRCEFKKLIDKGICDKGSIWNSSNCECECDKSCDVSEDLNYEKCKCRKKLVNKLIEECTENVKEAKLAKITSMELHSTENENKHKCSSCTLYIVLFSIIFATYFVYCKYLNRNKEKVSKYNDVYQATNYLYKWEMWNKLTLKIKHITFWMTWSILKTFIEAY